MIRLVLLGADTQLLSSLCASCPQGPAGCCVAPPEYDWSDIGRVVVRGGRDWLLAEIVARRVEPASRGLAVRRVRKREAPDQPRQSKCAFHGPRGCTIDHDRRPATCNYFLCDDTFREGGEERGHPSALAARRAHAILREAYERWDREIEARMRAAWPEGITWDAAFLDWLGAELSRVEADLHPLGGGQSVLGEGPSPAPFRGKGGGTEQARDLHVGHFGHHHPLSLAPEGTSAIIAGMSKITLKLRDLSSGNASFREFADEEATVAFLRERPRFTEVLGVVFEGLTKEQNDRLKSSVRPLDAEEIAAEERLEEAAARAAEAAQEQRRKEEEAARAAHREALKGADPNRPMEVRYRYDGSIAPVDPEETRTLCDEARAAVLAWVAERNEWVADRNQVVGEAKLTVWPAALPKPGADRVRGGSFVPVTAAPKSS